MRTSSALSGANKGTNLLVTYFSLPKRLDPKPACPHLFLTSLFPALCAVPVTGKIREAGSRHWVQVRNRKVEPPRWCSQFCCCNRSAAPSMPLTLLSPLLHRVFPLWVKKTCPEHIYLEIDLASFPKWKIFLASPKIIFPQFVLHENTEADCKYPWGGLETLCKGSQKILLVCRLPQITHNRKLFLSLKIDSERNKDGHWEMPGQAWSPTWILSDCKINLCLFKNYKWLRAETLTLSNNSFANFFKPLYFHCR